jgi:hypothetical protein
MDCGGGLFPFADRGLKLRAAMNRQPSAPGLEGDAESSVGGNLEHNDGKRPKRCTAHERTVARSV